MQHQKPLALTLGTNNMPNNITTPAPYGVMFHHAAQYDVDMPETENAAFMIDEPDYKGIVVRFKSVGITEENGALKISFDYDKIAGPEVPAKKKADFELTLGNVVHDLLIEKLFSDK